MSGNKAGLAGFALLDLIDLIFFLTMMHLRKWPNVFLLNSANAVLHLQDERRWIVRRQKCKWEPTTPLLYNHSPSERPRKQMGSRHKRYLVKISF